MRTTWQIILAKRTCQNQAFVKTIGSNSLESLLAELHQSGEKKKNLGQIENDVLNIFLKLSEILKRMIY